MYLLNLILRWRIHLIIITASVVILSIIFSSQFFIKPKYKSYTTVYPSNLISYSNETVTEQMLQIFKSDDIRDKVVQKFKLADHYEIDTTASHFKTSIIKTWNSNVTIRKTEFESVEIEVLDTDPVLACRILNEMIELFNLKVRSLMREKTGEIVKMLKKQMDDRQAERDTLESKLDKIRKEYNILDYGSQVREATRGYVLPNGKNQNASNILNSLILKGGEFNILNAQLESAVRNYLNVKTDYDNAIKDLTKELTYTNVINKPVPADKKCYPIRWLIVVLSAAASLLLSIIILIGIEKYRETIKQS